MNSQSRSTLAVYWNALIGLLRRDALTLGRSKATFLTRTITNPLMFVFVFAYLLPKLGQGVPTSASLSFGTVMFPGLIAVAIFFQGIMAVGLPLAVELGTGREIDDRLVAPVPLGLLAAEKIIFSTFQSIVAALVTFPFLYFIPALPIHLTVPSWTFLVGFVLLSGLASGAVGLMLGTLVKPQNISAIFTIIITPMTFLGCVYYPWIMLFRVPLLQKLVLLNPLVYVSEGMRATLTAQVPHLSLLVATAALSLVLIVTTVIGVRGFMRRVIS